MRQPVVEAEWLQPKMFHVDPAWLHQSLSASRLIVDPYINDLCCTKRMGSSFLEATKPRGEIKSRRAGGSVFATSFDCASFLGIGLGCYSATVR
jgi:hypothetical protein